MVEDKEYAPHEWLLRVRAAEQSVKVLGEMLGKREAFSSNRAQSPKALRNVLEYALYNAGLLFDDEVSEFPLIRRLELLQGEPAVEVETARLEFPRSTRQIIIEEIGKGLHEAAWDLRGRTKSPHIYNAYRADFENVPPAEMNVKAFNMDLPQTALQLRPLTVAGLFASFASRVDALHDKTLHNSIKQLQGQLHGDLYPQITTLLKVLANPETEKEEVSAAKRQLKPLLNTIAGGILERFDTKRLLECYREDVSELSQEQLKGLAIEAPALTFRLNHLRAAATLDNLAETIMNNWRSIDRLYPQAVQRGTRD